MTQRTEGPDLKRHLAQLEQRVERIERRTDVRATSLRPTLYVHRAGDTMTGDLAVRTGTNQILLSDDDGAEGFWISNNGVNVNLSSNTGGDILYGNSGHAGLRHRFYTGGVERLLIHNGGLDTAADIHANRFWAGVTTDQRIEIARHDGPAHMHFFAPGESLNGHFMQETLGVAGTTRHAWLRMSPSTFNAQEVPELSLYGQSEDASTSATISLYAGNGTISTEAHGGYGLDHTGEAYIRSSTWDVGLSVGIVAAAVRVLDYAGGTFRPIEASAFTISSDPAVKDDIKPAPANLTATLRDAKVICYRMKDGWDDNGTAEQIGIDATTMPPLVQRSMEATAGEPITGVNLGAAVGWLVGVVKEMDARLSTVETELADTRQRLAAAEAKLAKQQ